VPIGFEAPVMRAEFAAKPVHRRYRPNSIANQGPLVARAW